jgi:hypothetical protein
MGVKNVRFLIHGIFIILLAFVTFFGLGPVILADGVLKERIITALLVIVLYVILVIVYRKSLQWVNHR